MQPGVRWSARFPHWGQFGKFVRIKTEQPEAALVLNDGEAMSEATLQCERSQWQGTHKAKESSRIGGTCTHRLYGSRAVATEADFEVCRTQRECIGVACFQVDMTEDR